MRFLHTGDLHLDSAFCASSATEAAARRARQREVLEKIFRVAKNTSCDMVLISGDLFDTAFVTQDTREACIRIFEKWAKPIVISPGNHDAYTDGSLYKDGELPENVYVFSSPELQRFDFPELDASVEGYAFTSSALTASPLGGNISRQREHGTLILCAHADVDVPTSRYAPVLLSTLEHMPYDYMALGHIHKPRVFAESICYCGFAEGRSFDECSDGGVWIVDISGGETRVRREIISEINYEWETLSLDGTDSPEALTARVEEYMKRYAGGTPVHLRLELVGTVAPESLDALGVLRQKKYEGVISFELRNSMLALPNKEFLERDCTLRGELYRSLSPLLYSEDSAERKRALRALSIGLAAIDGKDFAALGGDGI